MEGLQREETYKACFTFVLACGYKSVFVSVCDTQGAVCFCAVVLAAGQGKLHHAHVFPHTVQHFNGCI